MDFSLVNSRWQESVPNIKLSKAKTIVVTKILILSIFLLENVQFGQVYLK